MSLRNIQGLDLRAKDEMYMWDNFNYEAGRGRNKYCNNKKLDYQIFYPQSLTKDKIIEIAKKHSLSIARIFGVPHELCF